MYNNNIEDQEVKTNHICVPLKGGKGPLAGR